MKFLFHRVSFEEVSNIQVNYDGTVFHAKIEFPETEFHMQTDNINDFQKEFLSEMSKTFDDAVHEPEPSRYSTHTNLENGNKKTYEIGSIKHKYYDLETVTVNENLKYISYNKNNMERTRYKKYHHVELVNVNGIGTGQIHFITDNGSYLMLPWCYIISMVPCEE